MLICYENHLIEEKSYHFFNIDYSKQHLLPSRWSYMCFQFISQALLLLLTWLRHGIERFPHYVQFVRGIYQLPVDSYHKGPSFDIFFDVSLNKRLNSAVTAVKYECDTINLTGTFARPNILLTDKLTKGASLYNPHPGSYPNMFPCDLLLVRLLVAAKKRPRWHKHTCLTHWGGNKMAANLQTTFPGAFSWPKYSYFDSNFTQFCS